MARVQIATGSGKPRRASDTKTTLFVSENERQAGRLTEWHVKMTRQIGANAALRSWYTKELKKEVRKMAQKTEKEILALWEKNTPKMTLQAEQNLGASQIAIGQDARSLAEGVQQFSHKLQTTAYPSQDVRVSGIVMDSSPAVDLANLLRSLRYYFKNQFSTLAERVARKFTKRAETSATVSLKNILKEEGFGINFRLTRELNDILQATIAENVNLIKSIHPVYFDQVQTIVMQGVKNGRDMNFIRQALQERFQITDRKARIIARDQTNKAMQAISRARSLETGLTDARWIHVPGAKTSRETHKHFDGQTFDIRKGLYDKDVNQFVKPGDLINCNCRFALIIPKVAKNGE